MSPLYNKLHHRRHMGQFDIGKNSSLWVALCEWLDDNFYQAINGS